MLPNIICSWLISVNASFYLVVSLNMHLGKYMPYWTTTESMSAAQSNSIKEMEFCIHVRVARLQNIKPLHISLALV